MSRSFLAPCSEPTFLRSEAARQSSVGKSGQHSGLGGETHQRASGSVSTLIREAERTELTAMLALLTTCELPVDGVEENVEGFLVARENETLIGTIGLECYGHAGLLRSLAVAASGRDRGLGGRLVKERLDRAKESGVTTIYLLTETAEAFFPRFGFERMPREELDPALKASKELQGACPETAVAMRLGLLS